MRLEGWEKKLADLLAEASNRRFEYGIFDCCLFACQSIEALTGSNPADKFSSYRGEKEAMRFLARHGDVGIIADKVTAGLGFTKIPALFAQRGDVALATINGRETLGVCTGKTFAFPCLPRGLAHYTLDSSEIVKVWRVE